MFRAQDWKLFLFRLWENVLLTRYIASLQYFIRLSFSYIFWRQWKSISMFGCFLSSSIVSPRTARCVLEKQWSCLKWKSFPRLGNLISRRRLLAAQTHSLKYVWPTAGRTRTIRMPQISILSVASDESMNHALVSVTKCSRTHQALSGEESRN